MSKRSFAELNKFPKYTSGKGKNKTQDEEGNVSDEELMPKALPLENTPDEFETEDSIDALQYLKRVRQEANTYEHNSVAKNLTNVVSAPISHNYAPNSYLFEYFDPNKQNKMQFLKEISPEWKEHITKTFESIKQSLIQTKTSLDKGVNPIISTEVQEDKDDYKTLFSKRKDFKDIFNQKDLTKQKPPKVAAFSQFDRVVGEKLLDWVCDEITKIEEKKSIMNSFQSLWLYSILLLFDKPLLPETSGDLNQILTYIVRVLAQLEDQAIAQEKDPQGDIKPALIVNAIIIMEYFGQKLYNM